MTGGIAANWGFRSPNFPFLWGALFNTILLGTTRRIPAKCHLILSSGFSGVHKLQTAKWRDRQCYSNISRNRWNCCQPCRLKTKKFNTLIQTTANCTNGCYHHNILYHILYPMKTTLLLINDCEYSKHKHNLATFYSITAIQHLISSLY